MYEFTKQYKKPLIVLFIVLVAAIVAGAVYLATRNPYGDELNIDNLSTFTKDMPSDKEATQQVKHGLFDMVDRNNKRDIKNKSIKDILVRENSFQQSHDDESGDHLVEFMVDIESLQQSYLVRYRWTDRDAEVDKELEDGDSQYGIIVLCLPVDQLIYGDFNCRDLISDMRGSINPYIAVDWSIEDKFGASVESQLLPLEREYIEDQVAGDYDSRVKLKYIENDGVIQNINREVDKANTLSFEIKLEEITYGVKIDYDKDERPITITNLKVNKKI